MTERQDAPYVRFPTVFGDRIVFASEDDLWQVGVDGGEAMRLTAGLGTASSPRFSPDGAWIAYVAKEEGEPEIYVMPGEGGDGRRLTYGYAPASLAGWTPDGRVVLASGAREPFSRYPRLLAVSPEGGVPEPLGLGPAREVAFGPGGRIALGRNTQEPAYWKRYRGGTTGEIWVDAQGSGAFRRLDLPGNLARPMWVGERLYFLSDHEGVGNLYSCREDGSDLRRHTDHVTHYARGASTDGRTIVYHAGGDLYRYDPATEASVRVPVRRRSGRSGRERRFVDAARFLERYALDPKGRRLAITTRGKPFVLGNWEGPVRQLGASQGVRYRLTAWLHDGQRLVTVSDRGGEEALEVHDLAEPGTVKRLEGLDLGRVEDLVASPVRPEVAVANHRFELWLVDLETGAGRQLDRSQVARIEGMAYAPDGEWVAYSLPVAPHQAEIRLVRRTTGEVTPATRPVLRDLRPSFDPTGTYLYFLGERVFDPVYDNLGFDLGFPRGIRPYMILLRKETPSPFLPDPLRRDAEQEEGKERAAAPPEGEGPGRQEPPKPVGIDLDGLPDRVLAVPVPEGRYAQVTGLKDKVLFTSFPVEGSLHRPPLGEEAEARGTLEVYDLKELKQETLASGVADFTVSLDGSTLAYRSGRRLRVVKAGVKVEEVKGEPEFGRKNGWVNLDRVKVSVDPPEEWRQMLREAWRLMRDNFWAADMSQVDWEEVYRRYLPLLDRVASRSELSDLIWEMQGELGTSHAYEMGGDYRPDPPYSQGHLAADLRYDPAAGGYRIDHIVCGDPWTEDEDSPLRTPGVGLAEGDLLVAVDGQPLGPDTPPERLLVNRAGAEVELTVEGAAGRRRVTVRALASENAARYREWVEQNRKRVHDRSEGRLGYLHVPDMMGPGFAEFHRGYWHEVQRPGLIVDVRFNRGGHVSQLLLEKLARRRIGYDVPRRGQPEPYPLDAPRGPVVALTNEMAGSDGDIFSHAFKLMGLGTLVGKRTWGGVIGIWARHRLVDGTVTTQPEFAFWFVDVGWGVENYGTDPDVPVENTPMDYAAGRDRQLEVAIELALRQLEERPSEPPAFGPRPARPLPRALPPRQGSSGRP